MKKLLLGLSTFLALSSFAFAEKNLVPEKILGLSYDSTGVTFQVESGGCTAKSDFSLIQTETYPPQITLIRIKPDVCEAHVLYGTDIKFTYEELGQKSGSQFEIVNELKGPITVF